MTPNELRTKHPRFTYESYVIDMDNDSITATFHFSIEPNIHFSPGITIPKNKDIDENLLQTLVFHLGLIEALSYWKATCSPEILIKAGYLSPEQIVWWHEVYMKGLGEFFYTNDIDFTSSDFLNIQPSSSRTSSTSRTSRTSSPGSLILVGGGKDSAVTLQLLKDLPHAKALIVNPTPASLALIRNTKYEPPLLVKRIIDPKLLELNKAGYLNGHTPFSALLAFVGITTAILNGMDHVIASNEQSASEGNVVFKGHEINHQYSKGIEFEKLFREYCHRFIAQHVSYFSFLRPLYDLQIAKLFVRFPHYHTSFRSCNVGRGETWCAQCSKCAFVYLTLAAFMPSETLIQIFGSNFFQHQNIAHYIANLVGLDGPKPFECVGTKDESIAALVMASAQSLKTNQPLPDPIVELLSRLNLTDTQKNDIVHTVLTNWNTHHFLSKEYEEKLKYNLLSDMREN